MEQTITAKLQIRVNPSDRDNICSTMKAYSDACNDVSEYIYVPITLVVTVFRKIPIIKYGKLMVCAPRWQCHVSVL